MKNFHLSSGFYVFPGNVMNIKMKMKMTETRAIFVAAGRDTTFFSREHTHTSLAALLIVRG